MIRLVISLLLVTALVGCKDKTPAPESPSPSPTAPVEPPASPMAADAGEIPKEPAPHIADRENPAIASAVWEAWSQPDLEACADAHREQLKRWLLVHCKAQLELDNAGVRLAAAADLPALPLPLQKLPTDNVFLWNNHSTEVPDPSAVGGRRARFRDKPEDSPFHAGTLGQAAGNLGLTPILAVDGARPVREVAEALALLEKAGHEQVSFAFVTTEHGLPLPPDPAGLDKMAWQTAAPYMREAMKGCGPMGDALEAVAKAKPESRCGLLADRIPRAMQACSCKMADRHAFLRNLHLFVGPPRMITSVTVKLGGTPRSMSASTPWAKASAILFSPVPEALSIRAR